MSDSSQTSSQAELLDWRRLLTAAERQVMLTDIAHVSLTVGPKLLPEQPWSEMPVSPGACAALKSPVEQLSAVEHLLPPLLQAVEQITQSPLTTTLTAARSTRPEHARRVTSGAWMDYARQPHRQTLSETVTLLSRDTPENQAVKSFLGVLKRDCEAVALIAEAEEEAEAAGRAGICVRQIERTGCRDWWPQITPKSSAWQTPPTRREILRPDYAGISRTRQLYRRQFCFEWDHPLLTLPPRETWRVYEVWCFLTIYRALVELGWEPAAFEGFAVRAGRLTLALAAGEKSQAQLRSADGRTLSLTYNRTFAEGRESLSHRLQPDVTLSDGKRVWILDAKFKPYAEPGEEGGDINQMHAYRDAIIGSDGTRSVVRAWCVYAGQAKAANRAQMTYGRGPDVPVGALCLRPGDAGTLKHLRELLFRWLA